MRRWIVWVGGGITLIGSVVGLAWLARYELLPYLLYLVGARYGVDRIYYEQAEWPTLSRLAFYGLQVEQRGWRLSADTLFVRLFPEKSVRIASARLTRSNLSVQPVDTVSGRSASLFGYWRLLRRFAEIDTIEWGSLYIEGALRLALVKHKDKCTAILYADSLHRVRSDVIFLQGDSVKFLIYPDSFPLNGQNFIAWDSIGGTLTVGEDALQLYAHAQRLRFKHHRLASRLLYYAYAAARLRASISKDTLRVIAEPVNMPLIGKGEIAVHESGKWFRVQVHIPEQPHEAYIRVFPVGFFSCLSQAQIDGRSSLYIELSYDSALPETLALQVDWQPKDFSIRRWGQTCTPIVLPETLQYRPYNSTRLLSLGPGSPTYLRFHQITPYVLHAVLHSEDGLFFYHQGFQKAHFLHALMENWRCKCFRRGAGTITMQLVRNLFLTREKTLARKVEEILLTALIERFRLLSKQQIAELYLNIIEWGPEIYGLVEASKFYFGKEPHELTIPEAIFLGMLLPSPKNYRYFIDPKSGCCLSAYKPHFQRIAYFLVKQNYLSPDSVESISPERVCLRAPAWVPTDSLRP
ncbi:MAG: biosynthetic peptidoglycan transglycosylase [Bacteroidia bacterium]